MGRRCPVCDLGEEIVESIQKDYNDKMTMVDLSKMYSLPYYSLAYHFKQEHFKKKFAKGKVEQLGERGEGLKQSETVGSSMETQGNSSISPEPEPEPDMTFQPLPMPTPRDPKVERARRNFARWVEQASQGDHDPYTSMPDPSMI